MIIVGDGFLGYPQAEVSVISQTRFLEVINSFSSRKALNFSL